MQTNIPAKRQLDPFALPSETQVRFNLLIVAALALSCLFGYVFIGLVGEPLILSPDEEISIAAEMLQKLNQTDQLEAVLEEISVVFGQRFLWSLFELGGICIYVLIVFGLAVAIYRRHPIRVRRQQNLQLFDPNKDLSFYDAIQNLINDTNISPIPTIEMNKTSKINGLQNGLAFGIDQHPALGLTAGVQLQFLKEPLKFKGFILHELAHIFNGDVKRTYLSSAIWLSFVLLGIIPMIIYIAITFAQNVEQNLKLIEAAGVSRIHLITPQFLLLCFQISLTLAIVTFIRSSLIRTRELYADWRVAWWSTKIGKTLADRLQTILERKIVSAKQAEVKNQSGTINPGKNSREIIKLLKHPWRYHPSVQKRWQALQDSTKLFQIKGDLSFLAGVLMAYVLAGTTVLGPLVSGTVSAGAISLIFVMAQWVIASNSVIVLFIVSLASLILFFVPLLAMVAVLFIPAYFIAWTIGTQVQRYTLETMVNNKTKSYRRLWQPAILITLGVFVGLITMPISVYQPHLSQTFLPFLGWMIIFVFVTWLWLSYVHFFTKRILGKHTGASPPKGKRILLNICATILLWVLYAPLILGAMTIVLQALNPSPSSLSPEMSRNFILFWIIANLVLLVIALLVYIFAFGFTWLATKISQSKGLKCPFCQQITTQFYAVGQVCEHENCNRDLAVWVYADSPTSYPKTNSEPENEQLKI